MSEQAAQDGELIAAFKDHCAGRRALVLEDDAALAAMIGDSLRAAGFAVVETVADGREAVARAAPGAFDLLILDRNTPGLDGRSALEAIRAAEAAQARPSRAAALFLTALGADRQRIEGLVAGADDYVVKPVSQLELLARAAALLRRQAWSPAQAGAASDGALENGPLTLRPGSLEVILQDRAVKVTGREHQILTLLAQNVGAPVTRTMIWDRCWPEYNFLPEEYENRIDVHVARLRKRLETAIDALADTGGALIPDSARPLIVSIRNQGLLLRDLRGLG